MLSACLTAGKYGLQIDDIAALKEIFYGIYMEKAKNPTESIGLSGRSLHWPCHHLTCQADGHVKMLDKAYCVQSLQRMFLVPGSIELVRACREAGLRVAVASSADRVKVCLTYWSAC